MSDDHNHKGDVIDAVMTVKAPGTDQSLLDAGVLESVDVTNGIVTIKLLFTEETTKQDRWDIEDALAELIEPMTWVKDVRMESGIRGFEEKAKEIAEAEDCGCGSGSGGGGGSCGTGGGHAPAPPAPDVPFKDIGQVIAVGSGKGGVGKSTVAVNLALALKEAGFRVGLLDLDIYGPSMPTLLGINKRPNVRAKQIMPIEVSGLKVMSLGFLMDDDAAVIWRGPILTGVIRQFIQDVDWSDIDYLIVDLPPGTGDAQLSFIQTVETVRGKAPDGVVIVTTPSDLALIDAARGLKMFETMKVDVLGVVENMAYYEWPGTPELRELETDLRAAGDEQAAQRIEAALAKYERGYIFGKDGGKQESKRMGTDLLGEVPLDGAMRAAGDEGRPVMLDAPKSTSAEAFRVIAAKVVEKKPVDAEAVPEAAKKGVFSFINLKK